MKSRTANTMMIILATNRYVAYLVTALGLVLVGPIGGGGGG